MRRFGFLLPLGARLIQYIHEPALCQSPMPRGKDPFEYTFGAPLFEYIARNPDAKGLFDGSMPSRRQGGPAQLFEIYPAATELTVGSEKPAEIQQVTLVDVGGSKGHDLIAFAKAYPKVQGKLVLEDLPVTFSHLEQHERCELADARVSLQEHGFFAAQPIRGAHAYFFHDICHDWPDEDTRRFLANTAEAMTERYSRLLIEDFVVYELGAHYIPVASDVLMMLIMSGIECTRQQWEDLLDSVGLKILKVWPGRRGQQSVIEAMKK